MKEEKYETYDAYVHYLDGRIVKVEPRTGTEIEIGARC